MTQPWWERGVIYQVYVRSYADANGDGVGDLQGVISRLDYLEWLGVHALWLSPTFPSPNRDWGYDVADYYGVHPELGRLADLEALLVEAGRRDIRVLLDLVPNHTSDAHPWFRDPSKHDWYVWRDPKPDGSLPNNWRAAFGGSAWTFDDVLRFWFERGVAGFRIDVAHALVKDRKLRDNPPARSNDSPTWRRIGQRPKYNTGQPEVIEVHRRWRRVAQDYEPERLLLGETYVLGLDKLISYYAALDGLHLCMNFVFVHSLFVADALAAVVAETERRLPPGATPVWHASSHDQPRFATRWCGGDEAAIRCALVALLSLRGAAILYQGDEIGLEAVAVPAERELDMVGRDSYRTPMVWRDIDGAGFTAAGVKPWLPIGTRVRNVATQRDDPQSILTLTRDLITLRRHRGLLTGAYEPVVAPDGVWAFRREGGAYIALNLGDAAARLDGPEGAIVLCTDRSRDGEVLPGTVELRPREAIVASVSGVG